MRRVVLASAATLADGGAAVRDGLVDANRLRRMDRFGRSGALAGARCLDAAGVSSAGGARDARFGVVVGTAFGCRDAVTRHARLLAAAARVEDLAPAVFAATVHNSVGGELAILYGLGGVAETLVSGRTAGLEALALGAARIARGDADRVLVVAAEGIDDAMRAAWERENPGRTLVESAAAVLLVASEEDEEEDLPARRGNPCFVDATLSFEPSPRRETSEEGVFLEGVSGGGAAGEGGAVIERLGATGLWEIAQDVAAHRAAAQRASASGATRPHSPSKKIHRYAALDVHGSRAAVTLAFFA